MLKAAVIGSGIGGIASALRLKAKGYEVDVFEANKSLGGKLAEIELGEYRFDMGPSLFTLPQLVDELFTLFGEDPADHFNYVRLPTLCNYFWDDGSKFSASAKPLDFVNEAAKKFGIDADLLGHYLYEIEQRHQLATEVFINKSLHRKSTWLSKELVEAVKQFSKLGVHTTLHNLNADKLKNPQLTQLFDRFATYNGSSPYKTPGVMSVIPYLEMFEGAYFPKNGMRSIVTSLIALGKRNGVQFHANLPVDRIMVKDQRVKGLEANKQKFNYDLVVSNSDVFYTYNKLLPDQPSPKRILKQERSSSALVFYFGVNRKSNELDVHNIFFSNDYKEEFDQLFNKKTISKDPTVYVHISSKVNSCDAPAGKENWFVMINTPSHEGELETEEWIQKQRKNIINKINKNLHIELNELIEEEFALTPYHIEQRTQSYKGALYGTASNSKMAAFLRHPNFSSKIKGLYFVGGSAHPGGGIPLCLSGAKIVDSFIPAAS